MTTGIQQKRNETRLDEANPNWLAFFRESRRLAELARQREALAAESQKSAEDPPPQREKASALTEAKD